MGERKVLNKYFPPDFDPAKLPRGKRAEHNSMKVRMMLPMSIRCGTCGAYMYKGTKFNSTKEDAEGENYLGIQVFRFYFRCSSCAAEITMKTDPKNGDYAMESGGTRNYEPWRQKDVDVAAAIAAREEEEKGNAMKALENRTLDSKVELDIMNALDEMQSLNARHERVPSEAALAAVLRRDLQDQGVDDERDIEAAVAAFTAQRAGTVRRLADRAPPAEPAPEAAQPTSAPAPQPEAPGRPSQPEPPKPKANPLPFGVKVKRKAENGAAGAPAAKALATGPGSSNGGSSGRSREGGPPQNGGSAGGALPEEAGPSGGTLTGMLGDYGSGSGSE